MGLILRELGGGEGMGGRGGGRGGTGKGRGLRGGKGGGVVYDII